MGSPGLVDRLVCWAVPRSAVELPAPSACNDVLALLRRLRIEVPPPEPVALRWQRDGGYQTIPASEAIEDEDVLIYPDQPDLTDLARAVTRAVYDADERFPGPLSWRRWHLTGRLSSLLYRLGVTRSGGSMSRGGRDPIGGWVYRLPRWSHVLPQRGGCRMRPYVLGLRSWWWECQRRQGWQLRGRHWPREPFGMGICAACLPCPSCGALYECRNDCETLG